MKKLSILLALSVICCSAHAADVASPVDMTVQQCAEVAAAIQSLDKGYVDYDKDKKPLTMRYQIDTSTLWALADDLTSLNRYITTYRTAAKNLFDRYADKEGKIPQGASLDQFNSQNMELLSKKVTVSLIKVKKESLKGPIPISTLSALHPIIEP